MLYNKQQKKEQLYITSLRFSCLLTPPYSFQKARYYLCCQSKSNRLLPLFLLSQLQDGLFSALPKEQGACYCRLAYTNDGTYMIGLR